MTNYFNTVAYSLTIYVSINAEYKNYARKIKLLVTPTRKNSGSFSLSAELINSPESNQNELF